MISLFLFISILIIISYLICDIFLFNSLENFSEDYLYEDEES